MTGASGALPPDITFHRASVDDVHAISSMAREIWTEVYSEMISPAQLDYMLEWMYLPDILREEIAERGILYRFINRRDTRVGYIGFSLGKPVADLHKLYLKSALHGLGFGSAALRWLADHCRACGADSIRLRVNKANRSAIRAYERNGYHRADSICQDIGGGFVMDDYIYAKPLV